MELILIIIGTVVFGPIFGWFYSFVGSFLIVIVGIPIAKTFVLSSKYKNLPNAQEMPDLILKEKGVSEWEIEFCNDLKAKFEDPKFLDKISKKQLRKLIEVYLERVRKVLEKEIDIAKVGITMDDKKIQ